jgi:hypothetical protein
VIEPARQPLRALEEVQPLCADVVEGRTGTKTGSSSRPRATADGMEGVGRRLDEEDAEAGIVAEQPRDEVLVPTPDAVPRLQGQDDEVAARLAGHSTPR